MPQKNVKLGDFPPTVFTCGSLSFFVFSLILAVLSGGILKSTSFFLNVFLTLDQLSFRLHVCFLGRFTSLQLGSVYSELSWRIQKTFRCSGNILQESWQYKIMTFKNKDVFAARKLILHPRILRNFAWYDKLIASDRVGQRAQIFPWNCSSSLGIRATLRASLSCQLTAPHPLLKHF